MTKAEQPTQLEKNIAKIFNENFPEPVTGDLPGYEEALLALIDQEVKKARIDELNELNYQIAKNSWHKENAYKMYPYILDRIAELEKDNK
ncbi:MAG TPA: hypothetical protein PKC05_03265 [Candidatus Saccharibacteria bacterium]|nr:hypothetical protein [Candidatus Saccharibacteria bacterium]